MMSTVDGLDLLRAAGPKGDADEVSAFCREVVAAGTRVRLPALLRTPPPGSLYHQPERHGAAVVAVPTTSLPAAAMAGLLQFRLAQYLDIGFIDRRLAHRAAMRSEPASVVAPGDIHVVAGAPGTGEVLCYAVLEQPPDAVAGCRLRSPDRPLYPVERVHGAGLYQRLPILPDLRVAKVRELGRFVKNQRPAAARELVARAVVELGVAVFRLVAGALRLTLDAVVGDLEEHVAKQNLDFFHIPSVVIHGTVPYQPSASYLYPRYQLHTVYPFACLASDVYTALPRLHAIDQALERPGKRGLVALLRLKARRDGLTTSMLHPGPGNHPLADLRLPQLATGMRDRSRLLRDGARLRQCELFAPLSVAEAAMLSTVMERIEVAAGQTVVTEGEPGDALYLVEAGEARLEVTDHGAIPVVVGRVGAGECCGHLAMLADAEHCVSVVAATQMTLLRLSKQAHDTYLAGLPDIDGRLSRHALRQWAELDRQRRSRATPPASGPGCACGDACACIGHHPDGEESEEPTP
jgi:cyclic nucleotide-binding protein